MQRIAITDGSLGGRGDGNAAEDALVRRCAELAQTGVEFVLIREKRLGAGALARLGRRVVKQARAAGSGTNILIARRVDVALAAGADGVHLSAAAGELEVGQVRKVMPGAFVSVSCHDLDQVRRAKDQGASVALFAPVFGKWVDGVQAGSGTGLKKLREACAAAGEMPVFALGGVTAANAAQCVQAGAKGVAAIRMFYPPHSYGG